MNYLEDEVKMFYSPEYKLSSSEKISDHLVFTSSTEGNAEIFAEGMIKHAAIYLIIATLTIHLVIADIIGTYLNIGDPKMRPEVKMLSSPEYKFLSSEKTSEKTS